jgi:nicotinamide-nucleotide amidase
VVWVGLELRAGGLLEATAAELADALWDVGVELARATWVAGDDEALATALREVGTRADLCLVAGGLGPEVADRTAAGLARAAGVPLVEDGETLQRLQHRARAAGLALTDGERGQARVPRGARVLPNDVGTAPGLSLVLGGAVVYAVPGSPREARWFCQQYVTKDLGVRQEHVLRAVTLRCVWDPGVHLERELAGLGKDCPGVTVHVRAAYPEARVRIVARGPDASAAEALLATARQEALDRVGRWAFSSNGRSLPGVVADGLRDRGATLAVAESCTGGWLQKIITDEPGSSQVLLGGVVAYSNDVKVRALGVSQESLDRVGAVSGEVAGQMARGARERMGADWGLSTTGVAGPGGGTEAKPVGLVHLGMATKDWVRHRELRLRGDRESVRQGAAMHALLWLLEEMTPARY